MPEFVMELLPVANLRKLIEERGYQVEFAYMDNNPEGRMYGANLTGPRGNKHFLANDREGRFSRKEAILWCDSVDYATRKTLANQSERRRKATKVTKS